MEECGRGYYRIINPNPWDENKLVEEWVPACVWKPVTTFKDVCETCGRELRYANTNGWPDEPIKPKD